MIQNTNASSVWGKVNFKEGLYIIIYVEVHPLVMLYLLNLSSTGEIQEGHVSYRCGV